MTRATDAYLLLLDALDTQRPPCHGDDRFTDDHTPAHYVAAICQACPLFDLCRTYATTARPSAGVWAGRRHGAKLSKGQK